MKMKTHCLACRKYTDNLNSRNVIMKTKLIRDKSRCGDCFSDKSRLLKQNHNKNVVGNIIKQTDIFF